MYSQADHDRIIALVNAISDRRVDSRAATYKDVPDLKEIETILEKGLDKESHTLLFAYEAYGYLAEQYTTMGRFSVAAEYRLKALKIAKIAKVQYDKTFDDVKSLLSSLLRDRNYYVDDDCLDIKPIAEGLLSQEVIDKLFVDRMAKRRTLKHDPVEMSEQYLAVIDEVEEKVEKNATMKGFCLEAWSLKEEYLLEKGILWKSPAWLNPRVRFD